MIQTQTTANERLITAVTQLKHLQGKHDQSKHGYRFGSAPSLSRARQLRKQGNWDDYKKRARDRKANGGKPGKRASSQKPFNGEVYHGSGREIDRFDLNRFGTGSDAGKLGEGVYFSADKSIARAYALMTPGSSPTVHTVKVSLKNPIRLEGNDIKTIVTNVAQKMGVRSSPEWDGYKQKNFDFAREFTKMAQNFGYDGVLWYRDGKLAEIVAFDPDRQVGGIERDAIKQANERLITAVTQLKHLQGKHDQSKHGYRFGSAPSLSRARQLRKQGNWDDYKKRARDRKANGGKPGKRASPRGQSNGRNTQANRPTDPNDPRRMTKAFGQDPNKQYEFRFKVVEMDDMIASNLDSGKVNPDYTKELQPRDRSRQASQQQIDNVARDMVAESLLTDFHQLDKGPMIVGDDMMVESGNGRSLALRRARDQYPEKYAEYTDQLKSNLDKYGLNEADMKGIKNPVLVRERISNVDRAEFAKEANQAAVLQMSPLEQAKVDAGKVRDSMLFNLDVAEGESIDQALRKQKNSQFVRSFMAELPENERAMLMRRNGTLNQMGLWRMKAAVFSKVFPGEAGERIADTFLESLDSSTKNFENSITRILPKLAQAEGLINSGQRGNVSIMGDVSRSLDMLARLRENNVKVSDYVRQGSLFERELTPRQERLLTHFDDIGRSPVKIREFFSAYADAVMNLPPPQQMGLFGAAREQTPDDIFAILQAQGLMG